ncbi:MAG: nucleotide exchange factor GrpE [Acidimicrobiales bacterium]|jgi:molecular chaperone GrpE
MTGHDPVAGSGREPPASTDEGFDAGPAEVPTEEESGPSDVEDERTRVTAERDEYLGALQRLQAEFENFRKRTLRQQTDLLSRASEAVVERLFPVLDALDLALAHVGDDEATAAHLRGALGQINSLLRETLAQEGLERIDAAEVPFDPTIHDAVAHTPRDESDDVDTAAELPADDGPQVVEVMRAGYRLKGRVLRPAMVKVKG